MIRTLLRRLPAAKNPSFLGCLFEDFVNSLVATEYSICFLSCLFCFVLKKKVENSALFACSSALPESVPHKWIGGRENQNGRKSKVETTERDAETAWLEDMVVVLELDMHLIYTCWMYADRGDIFRSRYW